MAMYMDMYMRMYMCMYMAMYMRMYNISTCTYIRGVVIHPIHCIGLYHCIVCIAVSRCIAVRIGGLLAGGLSGSEGKYTSNIRCITH